MPRLCLARQFEESVVIVVAPCADQLVMTVTLAHSSKHGKQLIFEGPREIQILRAEIAHAVMSKESVK